MPPKEQGELQGVRPAHIKRLEEIEDEIEKNQEKISEKKEAIRKLEAEACKIWDENSMDEPHIRGSNAWAVKTPRPRFCRKRHKIERDETEKKPARKATA